MDNLDNLIVIKEASGLIYNFKSVDSRGVPAELARLVHNYDP